MGAKTNPFLPEQKLDEEKPLVSNLGPCQACGDDILRPYSKQDQDGNVTTAIPDRGFHEELGEKYHADCWFSGKGKRARKVAA